jgi:SAM-dependent methyltransferase
MRTQTIAAAERDTYTDVFRSLTAYADYSPGEEFAPAFLEMSGAKYGAVLDAGCGTGKGGLALAARGFDVTLFDLTDAGLVPEARRLPFLSGSLWHPIPPWRLGFEYVYCCDVMEHLPTAFTMLVAANLMRAARRGAFFSISLVPDSFGVWLGKSLHQTVQSFTTWRDQLRELGDVRECRDLQTTGLYWVTRR